MNDPVHPPAPPAPAPTLGAGESASGNLPASADHAHHPAHHLGERAGDALGPYRLISLLGEGGFGVVWLAEQSAPVRRRVALKIIKPGMDSQSVITRFEGERQALAVLEHPGIAKVFDAGATPPERGSRPYFVMEYVHGVPITEYCDQRRLTMPQRLELFARVCDAVFHAHTKGIIHRDLKPSNILVTTAPAPGEAPPPIGELSTSSSSAGVEGQPKIIDFGVAKAIQNRLTDQALHTELGVLIGTPEYMSPEQADLSSQDIDTRADVYSLGVVLHELLTGVRPPRPTRPVGTAPSGSGSGAASSPRGAAAPASRGPMAPGPLHDLGERDRPPTTPNSAPPPPPTPRQQRARAMQGELAWIPLKALRVDRRERYRSAAEFADDVRNFLVGRALLAGPESTLYRVRKFIARHRAAVLTGLVGAALVGAGVVWLSVLYAEAAAQRRLAEQRARDSATSLAFLQGVFAKLDPSESRNPDLTMREVLDQVAPEALALAAAPDFSPEPSVLITDTLATAYFKLGDFAAAERQWAACASAARDAWGEDDARTLSAMDNRARALLQMGAYDEAQKLNARAINGRARTLGEAHPDTLSSRSIAARITQERGDLPGAERQIRDLITAQARSAGAASEGTLETRNNLADILHLQGHFPEAAREAQSVALLAKQALGDTHRVTLEALSLQSSALIDAGERVRGEALLRELLTLRRRVYGPDHPDTFLSENTLALLLGESNEPAKRDEGLALLQDLLKRSQARLGKDHPTTLTYHNNLAQAFRRAGRADEAERTFREVLAARVRVSGEGSVDTLAVMVNLALLLHEQLHRPGDALPLLQQARAGLHDALPGHWMVAATDGYIGAALRDLQRYDEALAFALRSYAGLHRTLGPENGRTRIAADTVWSIYEALGVPAQVKAWKKIAGR